jgi:hypothetical protein
VKNEQATLVQQKGQDGSEQGEGEKPSIDIRRRIDIDLAGALDEESSDGGPGQSLLVIAEPESGHGLVPVEWGDWPKPDRQIRDGRFCPVEFLKLKLGGNCQPVGAIEVHGAAHPAGLESPPIRRISAIVGVCHAHCHEW